MYRPQGKGHFVLLCEHASNFIPNNYNMLGVSSDNLHKHIAWDIGALDTAKILADILDAPLIYANYSRLLLDLNRELTAHDSIVGKSEDIEITGNLSLSDSERLQRQQLYAPFHDLAESIISDKLQLGTPPLVISIHSFTPVYHGISRSWHVGVLSQHDRRLADALLAIFRKDNALCVGDNQPYAPADGVYHSMQLHGEKHGLPCVMLEIRNDLITDSTSQAHWATRIAQALQSALTQINTVITSTSEH